MRMFRPLPSIAAPWPVCRPQDASRSFVARFRSAKPDLLYPQGAQCDQLRGRASWTRHRGRPLLGRLRRGFWLPDILCATRSSKGGPWPYLITPQAWNAGAAWIALMVSLAPYIYRRIIKGRLDLEVATAAT
jgi:hypothetical protein